MKMLIAVDGSKHSLNAVHCAIAHAKQYSEAPSVELVHVQSPLPRRLRMGIKASDEEIQRDFDEEGNMALMSAKQPLDTSRIPYTTRILVGPVAESIVEHAGNTGCDFIVLGDRGTDAVHGLSIGSTASKVLHLSRTPVLMVK
jgi:nucleotide-binding universal stress UspA family protein